MNEKKEIIENLEKVLKELKKEKSKPKTTEEYLEEISEKLSRLLDRGENEDLKKLLRNPFQREVFPNTKPYIIPDPVRKHFNAPYLCNANRTNYGPSDI